MSSEKLPVEKDLLDDTLEHLEQMLANTDTDEPEKRVAYEQLLDQVKNYPGARVNGEMIAFANEIQDEVGRIETNKESLAKTDPAPTTYTKKRKKRIRQADNFLEDFNEVQGDDTKLVELFQNIYPEIKDANPTAAEIRQLFDKAAPKIRNAQNEWRREIKEVPENQTIDQAKIEAWRTGFDWAALLQELRDQKPEVENKPAIENVANKQERESLLAEYIEELELMNTLDAAGQLAAKLNSEHGSELGSLVSEKEAGLIYDRYLSRRKREADSWQRDLTGLKKNQPLPEKIFKLDTPFDWAEALRKIRPAEIKTAETPKVSLEIDTLAAEKARATEALKKSTEQIAKENRRQARIKALEEGTQKRLRKAGVNQAVAELDLVLIAGKETAATNSAKAAKLREEILAAQKLMEEKQVELASVGNQNWSEAVPEQKPKPKLELKYKKPVEEKIEAEEPPPLPAKPKGFWGKLFNYLDAGRDVSPNLIYEKDYRKWSVGDKIRYQNVMRKVKDGTLESLPKNDRDWIRVRTGWTNRKREVVDPEKVIGMIKKVEPNKLDETDVSSLFVLRNQIREPRSKILPLVGDIVTVNIPGGKQGSAGWKVVNINMGSRLAKIKKINWYGRTLTEDIPLSRIIDIPKKGQGNSDILNQPKTEEKIIATGYDSNMKQVQIELPKKPEDYKIGDIVGKGGWKLAQRDENGILFTLEKYNHGERQTKLINSKDLKNIK